MNPSTTGEAMRFRDTDAAQLMTWMDIPPEHEDEFNAWYDKEHLAERVAIPGFVWARRYQAADASVRKYLALYRVGSIDVLASPAYQNAIEDQSYWSKTNLDRITNTFRRVMKVDWISGIGTGSYISLIITNQSVLARATMLSSAEIAKSTPGILGIHGLSPDMHLSTSMPREGSDHRKRTGCIVADAIHRKAATEFRDRLMEAVPDQIQDGLIFSLMWELRFEELER
ncbi:hypothetical protein ABVF61_30265 [Roseibium sp. HPY-6]|uniref:hypothetical protein n=1 Tax=Roseibium sp. HPY-6 TaxID=3229852 RepID=UPI00338D5CEC